jgi:hypothetical protein
VTIPIIHVKFPGPQGGKGDTGDPGPSIPDLGSVDRSRLDVDLQSAIHRQMGEDEGYAYAIVDEDGRMALAITVDGQVVGNIALSAESVEEAALSAAVLSRLVGAGAGSQIQAMSEGSDYAFAIVDSLNHVALGVRPDGTVDANLQLSITQDELGDDVIDLLPTTNVSDEYAYAIVDALGRAALWVTEDGSLGFGRLGDDAVDLVSASIVPVVLEAVEAANPLDPVPSSSGVSYVVVDEDGRRSWLEVGTDGRPTQRAVDMLTAAGLGVSVGRGAIDESIYANRLLMSRDALGNVRPFTSDLTTIAAWGDSLTDGIPKPPFAVDRSDSWPGVLDTMLASATVYNGGVSGQSADEIALRQGGYVLELSVAGGEIPTSGGVTVTTTSVIGWRLDRGWSCVGTLAGVPGTVSRSGSTLTFTRTSGGSAVAVASPASFFSTAGDTYKNAVSVFFIGRNDFGYSSPAGPDTDRIVAANVAMVERLGPAHPRFLLLGPTTATNELRGTSGHTAVTDVNSRLAALYPENYLDIRSYLVNESIHDQSITPTSDDLTKMAGDTLPSSIMVDSVHYTVATAATVAQQIHDWLSAKGWVL